MRILYLMDQMHLHGGAEKILSQKINFLIDHYGYEVHLLTTGQQDKKPVYKLQSGLIWKDLDINYISGKSYFSFQNLAKTVRHFGRLKKAIYKIEPDVVVSVSNSPDQYFLPFIARKIPKIKEFHSSRYNFSATGIKKELEKTLLKYDALVALNDTEKTYFPGNNVVVIPNFTDFKTGDKLQREKTVIAAGRIAPVKQFDELIKIWKNVASDFPDWNLKIFGDGDASDVSDLNALIKALDLSSSVFVLPAVAGMQHQMEKAAIYAMTSATECFPMVLLEARTSGLPIISYDCPNGPGHIVRDGQDAFLVPLNDRKEFSKKLAELMRDESLRERFAENSLRDVARFSMPEVMSQWDELFKNKIRK